VTYVAAQYPFIERDPSLGVASLAPLLPITLAVTKSISVSGLLDAGATVNVLPYAVGEQLGIAFGVRSPTEAGQL
jgi:hypothetical protein